MKCEQSFPWWLRWNPFIKVGANTADAKTHTANTIHMVSHGSIETPRWTPHRRPLCPPQGSVHCPPPTEKHAELYKKTLTLGANCICGSASVCLCVALRSERVARRDKPAEAPHPSTHADVNRCRSGQPKVLLWFWGTLINGCLAYSSCRDQEKLTGPREGKEGRAL